MRTKNFLIAFFVLVVGIIIYKLLFGFVLPIVLFVSLGSILKLLLKGSYENTDKEPTDVLKDSTISFSDNDVVEVKPMEENNTNDTSEDRNVEQNMTDQTSEDKKLEKTKADFPSENDNLEQTKADNTSEDGNLEENKADNTSEDQNYRKTKNDDDPLKNSSIHY